jgi:hypothetical protein
MQTESDAALSSPLLGAASETSVNLQHSKVPTKRSMGEIIFGWFQSKRARDKDTAEIAALRLKYGDSAKIITRDRANSGALSKRDRKHWRRIARKL